MKAIVLAGGSGERFWPLSTMDHPKQFLKLFGDRTLIENTCHRLFARFSPEDVLVITSSDQVDRTRELLPSLPHRNIIGEPFRRNTAPACALGAILSGEDELDLVVPADHRIPDAKQFWDAFDRGVRALRERDGLYTFGIHPTRPETGYGYIEAGKPSGTGVFEVRRFREKPDIATAREFIDDGGYYWNSGMFLWRSSTLLEELGSCSPDIGGPLQGLDPRDADELKNVYSDLPARSIDYAVMERSSKVFMIEGGFGWSDVGNWASMIELEGYSESTGDIILEGCSRIYVHSNIKKPVGVVGLNGVIIIDTDIGLLVCSEEQAQMVREVTRSMNRDRKPTGMGKPIQQDP
ncbi:MAG: mannose-1-phosphate guanylyltransferase [Candidatus Thermoplasmatota archaeon]|nr:mannose-1-phosphate guanylyltransferase [Candidatus Thermoplasmatota archaeon]